MNLLIYDETCSLCYLVRSTLIAAGHRASISSDPRDALLKLDTALFDAVLVGPSGAPRILADYLEEEMAHLPILLAGVRRPVQSNDRIHAVLGSPVDLEELLSAVRSLESKESAPLPERTVTITLGEGTLTCRANRMSRKGMIVEREGSWEAFHGFFDTAGCRELRVVFSGDPSVEFRGQVKYLERGPANQVRTIGVTFDPVEDSVWNSFVRQPSGDHSTEIPSEHRSRKTG